MNVDPFGMILFIGLFVFSPLFVLATCAFSTRARVSRISAIAVFAYTAITVTSMAVYWWLTKQGVPETEPRAFTLQNIGCCMLLCGPVLAIAVLISHLRAVREKRYAEEMEMACPNCGYCLYGLTSDHCPECGIEVEFEA